MLTEERAWYVDRFLSNLEVGSIAVVKRSGKTVVLAERHHAFKYRLRIDPRELDTTRRAAVERYYERAKREVENAERILGLAKNTLVLAGDLLGDGTT